MADMGRKMQTMVRTKLPISGILFWISCWNWIADKRAIECEQGAAVLWEELTWNNHSLTPHNEDNLHRSELQHVETAPLHDCIAKLPGENAAVKHDCNALCDPRNCTELVNIADFGLHECNMRSNHEGEFESKAGQCHRGSDAHDQDPLQCTGRDTSHPYLEAERCHNESQDNKAQGVASDGNGDVGRGGEVDS